jgi:hypothetical protein
MIVQEVFGFVKRNGPGEVVRSEAEEVRRGLGVQGKGAAAPLPLPPRRRRDEWVSLIILSWTDWVRVGLLSIVITDFHSETEVGWFSMESSCSHGAVNSFCC